ncbi:hypothetical protein D3C86_1941860 [compost metagenome]
MPLTNPNAMGLFSWGRLAMNKQDKDRIVRIIVTAGILSIVLAGSEPSSFALISGQDSKSLARMGITLDNPSLSRTAISLIRISEEEAILLNLRTRFSRRSQ